MKSSRLFLLRHAKAGWAQPGMRDFDRPLNVKGIADARALGARMRDLGIHPEMTVCSTARRCRETLDLLAGEADAGMVVHTDALYSDDATGYLAEVRRHPDRNALMIVGHNPMTEDLAQALAGSGDKAAAAALARGFPTCGLAILRFDGGLSHAAPGKGVIEAFLTPSNA
jgi:phosphohistidine phosphatase